MLRRLPGTFSPLARHWCCFDVGDIDTQGALVARAIAAWASAPDSLLEELSEWHSDTEESDDDNELDKVFQHFKLLELDGREWSSIQDISRNVGLPCARVKENVDIWIEFGVMERIGDYVRLVV